MVVGCPKCDTKYRLDRAKLPGDGRKLRCGRCTHVFGVTPEAPGRSLIETPHPRSTGPPHAGPLSPGPAWAESAPSERFAEADPETVESIPLAPPPAPTPPSAPEPSLAFTPTGEWATDGEETEKRWYLADESGELVPHTRASLRNLIRQGSVDEETILAPEGRGDPTLAGEMPEFERYFRLRRGGQNKAAAVGTGVAGAAIGVAAGGGISEDCVNHLGMPAEHLCTSCHAMVPFWREIPRLLTYPLAGWGPFMILCCAVLSFFGGFLPGPGKVLYFFVLAYQLHILKESANGNKKLPDWPEMSDIWQVASRGVKVLLVTLIVWLPLIIFNVILVGSMFRTMSAGTTDTGPPDTALATVSSSATPSVALVSEDEAPKPEDYLDENGEFDWESYAADQEAYRGLQGENDSEFSDMPDPGAVARLLGGGIVFLLGNLILGVFIAIYYPMCLMIAAIFNTVFPALNPALILRCISRIKFDYMIALIFGFVLMFGSGFVQAILSIIPIGGAVLGQIIGAYLAFIWMHILGWTAYQGWDRLNWDIKI